MLWGLVRRSHGLSLRGIDYRPLVAEGLYTGRREQQLDLKFMKPQ